MSKNIKNIFVAVLVASAVLISLPAQAQLRMPTINSADVESLVRTEFVDNPDMIAIAKCESGFRQFTAEGVPLKGGGGQYIGVFQISIGHDATARNLGLDIFTLEGNIGYAKYLFRQRGTAPWSGCVSTPAAAPAAAPASPGVIPAGTGSLTINLHLGMVNDQVRILQQILNAKGFAVATSGPGSPGQETTRFGELTRAAVQKFQCAQQITCTGSESTTGYGFVGPKTRAALSK